MKKLLIMWIWLLAFTVLQVAILVWAVHACPALFWVSIVLWAATIAVFIYFVFRVGVKESLKYLWDYWFLTSK